jgi:hypothetical protein
MGFLGDRLRPRIVHTVNWNIFPLQRDRSGLWLVSRTSQRPVPSKTPAPSKAVETPSSTHRDIVYATLTHQSQTTARRGWSPRRCRGIEPLKTDEDTCISLATSQQSWQRSSSLE